MKRREILKWSAPVLSTAALPVHAQTSGNQNEFPNTEPPISNQCTTTGVGATTGNQSGFRGQTREIRPILVSTLNASAPILGGRVEWEISGFNGSGFSVSPASGSTQIGPDGGDVITNLTTDAGIAVGTQVEVTYTYRITLIEQNGQECALDETVRTHTWTATF